MFLLVYNVTEMYCLIKQSFKEFKYKQFFLELILVIGLLKLHDFYYDELLFR